MPILAVERHPHPCRRQAAGEPAAEPGLDLHSRLYYEAWERPELVAERRAEVGRWIDKLAWAKQYNGHWYIITAPEPKGEKGEAS